LERQRCSLTVSQAATEAKTIPEFKDALQLIWYVLPEINIDQLRKRLTQATACKCVSQCWTPTFQAEIVIIHKTDTESYI